MYCNTNAFVVCEIKIRALPYLFASRPVA